MQDEISKRRLEDFLVCSGERDFESWQAYCKEQGMVILSAADLYAAAKNSQYTLAPLLKEGFVLTSTAIQYDPHHVKFGTVTHLSSSKKTRLEMPYILTQKGVIPHLEALFDCYPCTPYFQALFDTADNEKEILKNLSTLTGKEPQKLRFMNSIYGFRRFFSSEHIAGIVGFRLFQQSAIIEGDMTPYVQIKSSIVVRT